MTRLNAGDIQELYDTTLALGHAAAFSDDCDLPSSQDISRLVGLQVGTLDSKTRLSAALTLPAFQLGTHTLHTWETHLCVLLVGKRGAVHGVGLPVPPTALFLIISGASHFHPAKSYFPLSET